MPRQDSPVDVAPTRAPDGNQIRCILPEDSDAAWIQRIGPQLLTRLTQITKSGFAVFRVLNPNRRQLVLVCAVEMASFPPGTNTMTPPAIKHLHCWQDADPFNSWGRVSVSGTGKEFKEDEWNSWSEEERAFALWVKEKAWFPVDFGNEEKGVIVMVRGEHRPFDLAVIAAAWLTAQVELIKCCPDRKHTGFLHAAFCLGMLREAPNEARFWRGACHALASANGLGWNRVWVFRETESQGEFECVTCVGHADKVQWLDAVSRELVSLDTEIENAFAQRQEVDSLAQMCLSPSPIRLSLNDDDFDAEYRQPEPVGERVLQPMFSSLSHRFSAILDKLNAVQRDRSRSIGSEFQSDGEVFYLPLLVGERKHLILLSQSYANFLGEEHPSLQLSTLFADHAARLAFEWETAAQLDRELQDEGEVFSKELVRKVTKAVKPGRR